MAALFQPYLRLRLKLCRLWWWTNGVTCTEKMTSRWRTNKHDLTLLFLWKTGLTFGCLCGEIFEKRIMRRSFLWIIKYMRAPVQEGLLTKSEPRWREDGTWCQAWSWTWWTRGRSTVERVAWQRLVDFPGVLFPRGQVDYGDGDCIAWYYWISGTRGNTAVYFFNSQLTSMLGSWMQGAGLSWCYLRCHRWSWRGWISSPHPTVPPWTWQDWLMSHRRIWRQENNRYSFVFTSNPPVPVVKSSKLIPYNALKGRTQKASHSVAFTYASNKEIDIVNVLVDHL